MIDPKSFVNALAESDIRFVAGVPDSLLKSVCACITTHLPPDRHVIAANEGSAIGLAIGHYLATGRPALVYLQNAGLGNVINPVTSLADPEVYGIPMLLMIGWRGEVLSDGTQVHDEPQHRKQGGITPAQLDILGVPYKVIDHQTRHIKDVISDLTHVALSRSGPVALVVRKKTFEPFTFTIADSEADRMSRETAIRTVVKALPDECRSYPQPAWHRVSYLSFVRLQVADITTIS